MAKSWHWTRLTGAITAFLLCLFLLSHLFLLSFFFVYSFLSFFYFFPLCFAFHFFLPHDPQEARWPSDTTSLWLMAVLASIRACAQICFQARCDQITVYRRSGGEGSGCREEQGIKPPSGSRLQLQSSDHPRGKQERNCCWCLTTCTS